jgi:hypothetical protein
MHHFEQKEKWRYYRRLERVSYNRSTAAPDKNAEHNTRRNVTEIYLELLYTSKRTEV